MGEVIRMRDYDPRPRREEPEVPADVLTVLRCFVLDPEEFPTSEYETPPDDCA